MVINNRRFLIVLILYVVFLTSSSVVPQPRRWEAVNDKMAQFNRGNNTSPEPNLDNVSSDHLLKALEELAGNLPQNTKAVLKERRADGSRQPNIDGFGGGNTAVTPAAPISPRNNALNLFPQDGGNDFNNESPSEINEIPSSENNNRSSSNSFEKMGMEKFNGGKPLGLFPRLGGEDKSIISSVSEMPIEGVPMNLVQEDNIFIKREI